MFLSFNIQFLLFSDSKLLTLGWLFLDLRVLPKYIFFTTWTKNFWLQKVCVSVLSTTRILWNFIIVLCGVGLCDKKTRSGQPTKVCSSDSTLPLCGWFLCVHIFRLNFYCSFLSAPYKYFFVSHNFLSATRLYVNTLEYLRINEFASRKHRKILTILISLMLSHKNISSCFFRNERDFIFFFYNFTSMGLKYTCQFKLQ